jgi:hypothetical protein
VFSLTLCHSLSVCAPFRRETTLKEIRQDALIVQVQWEGTALFLVVAKERDVFLNLAGKDGQKAQSLSDAALHLYEKEGKEWRRAARMKHGARCLEWARERLQQSEVIERDSPWPFSPPDLQGLAMLHVHTAPGDRWVKKPQAAD